MTFQAHDVVWTPQKSVRLWDYYGSQPQFRSTFFGFQVGSLVAKKFLSTVAPLADARILDFSSGQGDVLAALIPRLKGAQEVHALDFSPANIDTVRRRFRDEPRFKSATLATGLPCALSDNQFDVILATEVIEHLTDDELDGMLAECKRLLKPGGQVFFTTPNEEDYDISKVMCPECGCIFHRWQHLRTWTRENLHSRMESAGLRTKLVETVSWNRRPWLSNAKNIVMRRKVKPWGLLYVGQCSVDGGVLK